MLLTTKVEKWAIYSTPSLKEQQQQPKMPLCCRAAEL